MKSKKNYSLLLAFFVISFNLFKSQTTSDFFISDAKNEKEVLINCNYPLINGNCVALSANYPSFKQTDNYSVSSINYTPYSVVNKTILAGDLDDSFSGIIDLPFKFCFYGQTYTQLVIGSNGMISFILIKLIKLMAPIFLLLYLIKIYLKNLFLESYMICFFLKQMVLKLTML